MYNDERNKDMNKKRYTAPKTEALKMETQDLIATSVPSLSRGQYNDGDDYESENPFVDSNGNVYGD